MHETGSSRVTLAEVENIGRKLSARTPTVIRFDGTLDELVPLAEAQGLRFVPTEKGPSIGCLMLRDRDPILAMKAALDVFDLGDRLLIGSYCDVLGVLKSEWPRSSTSFVLTGLAP